MSKKERNNSIDNIFEAVFNAITNVKNHKMVLESPEAMKLWTFFTQHILDINNFQTLYKTAFIPAANKTVTLVKNDFTNSKYKSLINATEIDLKESLYETIRLGYVGLSHKIEGFTKGIKRNNDLFVEAYEIDGDFKLANYLEANLSVDFLNPLNIPSLNKIRIISNAVKHNNGYPQIADKEKDDIKNHINWIDMNSKINIDSNSFLLDIKSTIQYFEFVNTLVNTFSLLFVMFDDEDIVADGNSRVTRDDVINKFKEVVNRYIK